jgi:taurine dioxygenase
MTLQIHPLMDDFGAEVSGVDLAAADDATIDRLTELYYEHSLLILRDQHLTPGEQAALTARFGTPKIATRKEFNDPVHPTVAAIGNLTIDGKPAAFLNRQGVEWHSDSAATSDNDVATFLAAVTVPMVGGDTMWCSLHVAYETLTAQIQDMIAARQVCHSWNHHNDKVLRLSPGAFKPLTPKERAARPDLWENLVHVHPVTGRKLYYISHNLVIAISGLDAGETATLTAHLLEHATLPGRIYRHRWAVGDIAIWDNHAVMHSATEVDYDDDLRLMHRSSCHTHPLAWLARRGGMTSQGDRSLRASVGS